MNDTTRTVLITGACGDIGRSLSSEFACEGARLALCDLVSVDAASPLLSELRKGGTNVFYRQVDVTDPAAVGSFVADAARELGGINLCIGNAGIVERGLLLELSPDAWRRTLEVNLTGCFFTAQAAARSMIERHARGHIVVIGSWVQDVPRENIGAYCASKSGLKMLAKCLALELGPHGIRVNVVAPGFVDAGLTGQNLKKNPARRALIEKEIPLGRLVTADEVARAVRLFCSDDSSYVTGTTFLVDGGSSLFFRRMS